jgi:sigma-E factor negative regulatory protein RseC
MQAEQVEGIARVVTVDGDRVWFEPEPTSSCGGCLSATACGVKSGTRRLDSRRFSLVNDQDYAVGERVVVGLSERSLMRAAATAYGLPMLGILVGLFAAQWVGAGDGNAALITFAGLATGLLLARFNAGRLAARGELTPRFIRRVWGSGHSGSCGVD